MKFILRILTLIGGLTATAGAQNYLNARWQTLPGEISGQKIKFLQGNRFEFSCNDEGCSCKILGTFSEAGRQLTLRVGTGKNSVTADYGDSSPCLHAFAENQMICKIEIDSKDEIFPETLKCPHAIYKNISVRPKGAKFKLDSIPVIYLDRLNSRMKSESRGYRKPDFASEVAKCSIQEAKQVNGIPPEIALILLARTESQIASNSRLEHWYYVTLNSMATDCHFQKEPSPHTGLWLPESVIAP